MGSVSPFFSIVTPVYNPPLDVLQATIESVSARRSRTGSSSSSTTLTRRRACATCSRGGRRRTPRIRVDRARRPTGTSSSRPTTASPPRGASSSPCWTMTTCSSEALERRCPRRSSAHPDVDYLYSDEDKVDDDGRFYDEFRKPPWSPERLRGHMYTCHLSVLRTSLVREVGGFREGFDGSQDHDLVLRVTERARRIVHVPKVLYHWRVVAGLGRRRPPRQAVRLARRPEGRAGSPRPAGHRRRRRLGPGPGHLPHHPQARPVCSAERRHPDRGRRRAGLGRAPRLRRRGGPVAARHGWSRQPRDRRRLRHRDPDAVLDELAGSRGESSSSSSTTEPFNFSEKCNLGRLASHRRRRRPAQRRRAS